jgi:hypothetical protein
LVIDRDVNVHVFDVTVQGKEYLAESSALRIFT